MHFLIEAGAVTLTLLGLATVLPGVRIANPRSAIITALVFGVLSMLLGWVLTPVVVTLLVIPAVLTLGLAFVFVSFIVNTILLWLTDMLLDAFEIKNMKTLLITSLAITVVHSVVRHLTH